MDYKAPVGYIANILEASLNAATNPSRNRGTKPLSECEANSLATPILQEREANGPYTQRAGSLLVFLV